MEKLLAFVALVLLVHSASAVVNGDQFSDPHGFSIIKPRDWIFFKSLKALVPELKDGSPGKANAVDFITGFGSRGKNALIEHGTSVSVSYRKLQNSNEDIGAKFDSWMGRLSQTMKDFQMISSAQVLNLPNADAKVVTYVSSSFTNGTPVKLYHRVGIIVHGLDEYTVHMLCPEENAQDWDDQFKTIMETIQIR